MSAKNNFIGELFKLLLPSEIFKYFEIVNISTNKDVVNIYLDEQNATPDGFSEHKLSSNVH